MQTVSRILVLHLYFKQLLLYLLAKSCKTLTSLTDLIRTQGKVLTMTVNTPFLLDQSEKMWLVETGKLHIYTVKVEQGIPVGKRNYFVDVKAGQILLGMQIAQSASDMGLWVDATEDSILYELDLAIFKSFQKDEKYSVEVSQLVSEWIEAIFEGLSENSNHPNQAAEVLVKEGERVILRNGESISAQKNPVWAKVSASKLDSLLVNGFGNLYVETEDVLLPITRRSFLQSTRNVGMRFYTAEEALHEEGAWAGIRALDEIILQLEKAEMELIQTQEQARLKQKYQAQFQRTRQSLQSAQAILNPKLVDKYADVVDFYSDDYLFNACQVVASALNIDLSPPAEVSDTDPLGDIMRASRVRYREVLLTGDWWTKESGALLGFGAETGQALAIMPLRKGGYEVYNPETKETFKLNTATAPVIDKVAYTFYPPFEAKALSLWDILKFGIFRNQRDLYNLFLLSAGATLLGMIVPIITEILFDYVIPHAGRWDILHIGFALFMTMIGYVLFELTENYALLRLETQMDSRLQAAVWDRLLDLPVTFFRQFTVGDLADRTMGINHIRQMLSGVVITGILAGVFSMLNFVLLFYYSVTLALVALGLVMLEIFVLYLLGMKQIAQERVALAWEGKTQGVVLQMLTGISKFRVTGTEIRAFTHWLNHFSKFKQAGFQASQTQNIQQTLHVVTPILFNLVIFWALMQSGTSQHLSTGEFLAFNAAYGSFTAAMLAMSASLLSIYQIFPIYDRTKPILDTLPETDIGKANPGTLKGNIEVGQVNFRYDDDSPLVLQDVSLKLKAGEYVAFVGASGSGKSTLVRLLLGFEKAESGSIFYDNRELSQLDIRLVRRQIGVVLQDGQLTPGDILSNIIGTSPHLTMDDAWEATKLAAIEDDIRRMPMGMYTVINEGASTLSGGQKQRLLIAQVLVHKPRILIFDEATSALDNRTQAVVTQSLNKLQATRIVIAHRLSTIQEVDRIVVFDRGRIVQIGTYQELMAVEGAFRDLAMRQIE